jgi:hypothetical protein
MKIFTPHTLLTVFLESWREAIRDFQIKNIQDVGYVSSRRNNYNNNFCILTHPTNPSVASSVFPVKDFC